MERLQRLIGALWLGSAFFLLIVSSAVFRVAPSPTVAGDVVGVMLTRWHYVALGAPLVLFFLELRRLRSMILITLFAAILFAASQSFVDLKIRSIRQSSAVPISSLHESSPLRRQFGALHGASMALLLLQGIAAAIFVMARTRRTERLPGAWESKAWEPPAGRVRETAKSEPPDEVLGAANREEHFPPEASSDVPADDPERRED